ncbi:endonuclease/exonuclease/phosphatase family protein [Dongia sp.]|uniref:endonuclease/exonuclease/phosphatase family protein n=1 Tax=Dongia sp. TaxID=1977262 RepID=UPI0037510D56
MRLVGYNTQFSRGRDGRIDIDRMTAAVRDADVLALQEVERHWQRSGETDQPAEIARRFPNHHWAYGPYFDVDASSVAADGSVTNRRRQFGVMTLSRWPILSTRLHTLPKFKTGPVFCMIAGMLETVIAAPGGPIRHYNLHLNDVSPDERLAQIARLFEVLWSAPKEGGTWTGHDPDWQTDNPPPMPEDAILSGDFNLVPGSPEYEALVGPKDRDFGYGRVDVGHRLVDAWVATGHGEAEGVTYPPCHGQPGVRIDYSFVTLGLAPRLQKCWIDNDAPGSDHQPVWIELS